jgi:hypothetical protein
MPHLESTSRKVATDTDIRLGCRLALNEAKPASPNVDSVFKDLETLIARLTAIRAGYLDNLNLGETVPTKAEINAEVDNALNTAIPASPTVDSINERIKTKDDMLDMDVAIYPVAADAIGITTSTTAWVWTGYSEIIAANTITNDFYLVGVVATLGDIRPFQVAVAIGAAGSEVDIAIVGEPGASTIDWKRGGFFSIDKIRIAANSRVSVKATDGEAAANAAYIYILVKK